MVIVSIKVLTLKQFSPLVVDCMALPNPTNGQVMTTSGTTFNNIATYSCTDGYTLSSSATRVCGSNGSWTLDAPTCLCMSVIISLSHDHHYQYKHSLVNHLVTFYLI